MIGACKLTVSLPNDAVDDFQKDILKPTVQVLFLTTPLPPPHLPKPCTNGAAGSLSLAMLDVLSKDIINPYSIESVDPTLLNRPVAGRLPSVVRNDNSNILIKLVNLMVICISIVSWR